MKRVVIIIMASLLALKISPTLAGDLVFPKTEAEIVEALSLKNGQTTYNGVEYISEGGGVYKVINGKRYKLRGLQEIVDSDLTPKAGALVHFELDSTKVKSEFYPLLDEYGKALKYGLSQAVIIIAGHTDSTGTEEYNQGLSKRRAKAVREYLLTHHGISADRLMVKGHGENKPIAAEDTKKGMALNRRVEFIRVAGF